MSIDHCIFSDRYDAGRSDIGFRQTAGELSGRPAGTQATAEHF
ncbi:hypothetical protein ACH4JS_15040 [Streptomyces sp. NPDC017638]